MKLGTQSTNQSFFLKNTMNACLKPEIYRLKGELLLHAIDASNFTQAEIAFARRIETARRQKARSLELRATTSLARLLRDTDRRAEARAMLADIYNWFTEGFDTPDLKDAKARLVELTD